MQDFNFEFSKLSAAIIIMKFGSPVNSEFQGYDWVIQAQNPSEVFLSYLLCVKCTCFASFLVLNYAPDIEASPLVGVEQLF